MCQTLSQTLQNPGRISGVSTRAAPSFPTMAEPLFMLRTLLPVALSQTAKIMVASSEQLSPDVLSTNAGSYYITVSSTTFYFEKKIKG